MEFLEGQRVRLPDERRFVVVEFAQPAGDGTWKLVVDDGGHLRHGDLGDDVEREVLGHDMSS